MANDFGARVERLERAAKAARYHALNLPPIIEVVFIDSDGDGCPAAQQSTDGSFIIDPMNNPPRTAPPMASSTMPGT